jgi:hypothetical protein
MNSNSYVEHSKPAVAIGEGNPKSKLLSKAAPLNRNSYS